MKNKNFRKLKYVSGNPQNAGFYTIYSTAYGGLSSPQTPILNCSASLRSTFSTYFFKIASYFWKPCSWGENNSLYKQYPTSCSTDFYTNMTLLILCRCWCLYLKHWLSPQYTDHCVSKVKHLFRTESKKHFKPHQNLKHDVAYQDPISGYVTYRPKCFWIKK